jgi:putative endonuclease
VARFYGVDILASRKHGTLAIGVTSNIARRVWEHSQGQGSRLVKRYRVTRLVHVETHEEIAGAIQREKTMAAWPRAWKIRSIERENPDRNDLCDRLDGWANGSLQQVPGRQPWLWQGRPLLPEMFEYGGVIPGAASRRARRPRLYEHGPQPQDNSPRSWVPAVAGVTGEVSGSRTRAKEEPCAIPAPDDFPWTTSRAAQRTFFCRSSSSSRSIRWRNI